MTTLESVERVAYMIVPQSAVSLEPMIVFEAMATSASLMIDECLRESSLAPLHTRVI